MNFNLNFKKTEKPKIDSFRNKIFNAKKVWGIIVLGFILLSLILIYLGLNIFYNQYFENYKKSKPVDSLDNIINIEKLDSLIKKRTNEINKSSLIPRDPSL